MKIIYYNLFHSLKEKANCICVLFFVIKCRIVLKKRSGVQNDPSLCCTAYNKASAVICQETKEKIIIIIIFLLKCNTSGLKDIEQSLHCLDIVIAWVPNV